MRSLILALLLAVPAAGQTQRQNVIEYVTAALRQDGGFSVEEQARLLEALRTRFAAYAFEVVRPGRTAGVQVVMRMIIEGHFDQAPLERVADVSFAAYQAISRGAPADVVEGVALYGYRKQIPAERISTWANGYRQLVDNRVPPEVAADLIRNAMERDWEDSTFDALKWSLVQAAKRKFDLKDYATYLFGHMQKPGARPGALSAAAQAYFKKLARTGAAPELPAYEGVFSKKALPEIVYEAKPAKPETPEPAPQETPAPRPKAEEPPSASEAKPEGLKPSPEPKPKTSEQPKPPKIRRSPARQTGLAMAVLWPGLEGSAMSYLGTPYVWGGTTRRGVDCSALTQNSYGENKVGIPRVSRQQWQVGEAVDYGDLREGDLVFFNTMGVGVSHVGMVVDPGKRKFIHASSSHGVVVAELSKNYYKSRYLGARRIVP